jgi:DMSO/TMAO reductase YedYZ molybdopterin-dependent catalytic subunit
VPFLDEGSFPVEATVGAGLGKRRALDLSTLSPETLVTPAERFFIRTGRPALLPSGPSWKVRVHGLVKEPIEIRLDTLEREGTDRGLHLLECAGNSRAAHFGFMSVARWTGVPFEKVLEKAVPLVQATQVLVSGFDQHEGRDPGSVPGASWIFPLDQVLEAGAFLATQMNGAPLGPDHGHPLRLVVPGWYGCAAIKWVNEIVLVDDDVPATEHMREYAGRTHQDPKGQGRARDFRPATLDPAAAAVRVEMLGDREGKLAACRIAGVLWGEKAPVRDLRIRTSSDQAFAPVDVVAREPGLPWALWSYTFRPRARGRHRIQLAVGDAGQTTRRLDAGFYAREVEIAVE